jgi:peptidylprolyl isomerase
MQITRRLLLAAMMLAGFAPAAFAQDAANTLNLDLKDGRVTIQLDPTVAPKTVAHIQELVRKGFYNNTPIHRVIPGFMAQMGDPTGTGGGPGSGKNVQAEFSTLPFERGTVAMARLADDINSNDSQFFIMFAPNEGLFRQYTIFGHVTAGMDVVDKIKPGTDDSGVVDQPDKIIKATLGDMP